MATTKSKFPLKTKIRLPSPTPKGRAYRVLPFRLCNAPATFQRAILNIFAELINEGLEVYMDDFTPYGDDLEQALQTLEKVLERCVTTRLCLSHEKCHMMMIEGLILCHYISTARIQVDPAKNSGNPLTTYPLHSNKGT